MAVDRYRLVDPVQVVEVLYQLLWRRGRLEAWRRQDGRWVGFVTFSWPDGVTQPMWFDQDDIRRRQ